MVKRLATSRHDPLGITDSACKNQSVVVTVHYGPFNTYIPIRSTIIGKSRVAKDQITMYTSWRSNSDIASVTRKTHLPKTHPVLWPEIYHTIISSESIGYPRMRASGESSTTKHRLLHASGPYPIPPPNDPKTNQYNQDLGLIHSTNGNHLESPNEGSSIDHQVTIHLHAQNITMFPTNDNHLESPNEGSSIDHQVTIHLHAQNITMFPTNETWYFTSQMLVSSSGGLILILTAQSTRNGFRMHSDY
ncbi:formin-like protein 3 [Dorcoceras hygrometricum]|uniref:Formin-like protein 3 n=1 Tax=Dorcoceras hygrometricum TaxID=472368 RepID=A0A2Z7CV53_9LAMI|nr:formin-like protein 3 [Dorcoceras hygrometricum]